MNKALIIPGVDFSANALTTVTLSEIIPCQSIALSQSSISFSALGATVTLTASVIPADTTFSVIWSSGNNNIATVSGGVVTCVGVGSTTITATCGDQSATCTVTSNITILESDLNRMNGYGIVRNGTGQDALKEAAAAQYLALTMGTNVTGGYQVTVNSDSPLYLIPIPKNVSEIEIVSPINNASYFNGFYMNFCDSKTKQTAVSGKDAAKFIDEYTLGSAETPGLTKVTVAASEIPEGADSFVLNFRMTSGTTPAACTIPVVITFT